MATTFPTTIDSFTNPTNSSNMNDVGVVHADQHANTNDAIEAIEAYVGVTGSTDVNSLTYKLTQKQDKVSFTNPPATSTSTGTSGQIIVNGGYLYVCVATNSWVRSAITSW